MSVDFSQTYAVVVEVRGSSYIKLHEHRGYSYSAPDNISANGSTNLRKAPGDETFLVFDGKVETLERIIPARTIVTKYALREDLIGSPKEELLSVDQYNELCDADQSLYRAVKEDIPREAEAIPFLVQQEDGPPSKLPEGVQATDKNSFARYKSFQHLGPVYATPRFVLSRLLVRLNATMKDNPLIKPSWSMRTTPEEILKSAYPGTSVWLEVGDLTFNGHKFKAPNLKHVFTIDPKDQLSGYQTRVEGLAAPNLDALERGVTAYIEQLVAPLSKWVQPDMCPCCQRKFDPKSKAIAKLRTAAK